MSSSRTEMLHLRATPEEKERFGQAAKAYGLEFSEYARFFLENAARAILEPETTSEVVPEYLPTQPGAIPADHGTTPGSLGSAHLPGDNETYEQFMERRVGELVGEDSMGYAAPEVIEQARKVVEAEWAPR